jgi:hypothetical protein
VIRSEGLTRKALQDRVGMVADAARKRCGDIMSLLSSTERSEAAKRCTALRGFFFHYFRFLNGLVNDEHGTFVEQVQMIPSPLRRFDILSQLIHPPGTKGSTKDLLSPLKKAEKVWTIMDHYQRHLNPNKATHIVDVFADGVTVSVKHETVHPDHTTAQLETTEILWDSIHRTIDYVERWALCIQSIY